MDKYDPHVQLADHLQTTDQLKRAHLGLKRAVQKAFASSR